MQKLTVKRKAIEILLIVGILSLCIAMFATAFVLPNRAAHAEDGNNASSDKSIALTLDVNGKDATLNNLLEDISYSGGGISDATNSTIALNGQSLSRRVISSTAAVDGYRTINNITDTTPSAATYRYVDGSIKCRSSKIDVQIQDGGNINLIVKALNRTEVDNPARFSVRLAVSGNPASEITVYYSVTVNDTFVQRSANSGLDISATETNILVGSKLTSELTEINPWTEDTVHEAVIENIENNTEVTLDLGELLVNRALYYNRRVAQGADPTDNATPLTQTTGKFWPLQSVSNFEITNVTMHNGLTTINYTAFNPSIGSRFSPRATFMLHITQSNINSYMGPDNNYPSTGDHTTQFWGDIHKILVSFRQIGGTTTYTVIIPVKFSPGNKPQIKTIDASLLSLNVTSSYAKEISSGKYIDTTTMDLLDESTLDTDAGFSAVVIRPTDLVEFSFPENTSGSDGKLRFFMSEDDEYASMRPSPDAGYRVERMESEKDEIRPSRLIVRLSEGANFNITFAVEYFVGSMRTYSPVTVSFSGYGKYAIKLEMIEGKRAVTFDTKTSDYFAALVADGFQMTSAQVVDEYRDVLSASFDNKTNVLTILPKVDNIAGQAKAQLRLEFINTLSQKVILETNVFDIDITVGSFWARFQDWEGGLIIAAAALGGLLLILLIVWLFIRALSKRREEENATQAPVSSYIVKLNATIAATQAQQRMSQMALAQTNSQMLLGANIPGGGTPLVDPNTLALASGVGGGAQSMSSPAMSTPSMSMTGMYSQPGSGEDYDALIAKYISDDELLERIYTEKYEPKGMVRRTFFKSKDLQARELEKEKKRIIERYKSPMPMDEAIMSESQVGATSMSSPAMSTPAEAFAEEAPFGAFELDFDPDSPLYVEPENGSDDEFADEKIDINVSPEETRLKELEKKADILSKELAELHSRLDKVRPESDKNKTLEQELREKIERGEADDAQFKKDIEDLEFKLASAKAKEKEKITRDIKIKEEQMARNADSLAKNRADLESLLANGITLSAILDKLNALQDQKTDEQSAVAAELEKAQAAYAAYKERLEQVRARQELEAKVDELKPLLEDVNKTDYELRDIQARTERMEKEREELKSEVATVKTQILGANDFDVINDLNTRISDINGRLSDIEKDITKATKRKSELNLDMKAQRRKANDFIDKNEIPLEEVIAAEDAVIGDIELGLLRADREAARSDAEQAVANAQAVYDDLSASSADVTMVAMEVAANVKDIEDEIEDTQKELDAINAKMEEVEEDEKLMLMVEQGDKSDKIEELKKQLEAAHVDGTKRKMEAQSEYDEKLEAAHVALDGANEEFKEACARCDAVENTNPLDLITSGSGPISQDQKKIEAENLKKQLERTKNEVEQARLAAEMAQAQAEQARLDAERATDEARAEAERKAQEAQEAAEAARLEAEERARNEVEAAEAARKEAEEAAERARKEAEEAAEQARKEAEEAAEQARREAEEAAEQARREAEEAAEQARKEAEEKQRQEAEAAEAARIAAEEQAKQEAEEQERLRKEQEEALRAEAEEAKRKAQEEIEEIKRKAEEEAEAKRKEEEERQKAEAERNEAIAKKVAARKEKIINFRDRMKDIKNDEDAKNLREQLYSVQLTFDEDERGSTELMDFYNKTMDDIQHAGEVAVLKAENAKKPKRIVRKVTERVNRIPKRRPGAAKRRPSASAKSGAHRPAGARPATRPGARPARPGARPGGRPGARPGTRPTRPR